MKEKKKRYLFFPSELLDIIFTKIILKEEKMIVFSQENSKSNRMLTSIVDKVDIKQNIQNIHGELLSNDTPFKILPWQQQAKFLSTSYKYCRNTKVGRNLI